MKDFKVLKRNSKYCSSSSTLIKVAILGDTATQLLATAIRGEGVERGFNIDLFEADYDQIERQVFDSSSALYNHKAKYTIIFQSTHKLLERYNNIPHSSLDRLADERLSFVKDLCNTIEGKIIYYNYPEIEDCVFGSYSNKVTSSFSYQVRKLNFELMNLAHEYPNLCICDIVGVQNKLGRDLMFDPAVYISTEMVLSIDSLPYVASRTLDIICSSEGQFKKCLILDLDNTVWGGIVGDDGWENIQIGHGLGVGKAFTEFQEWVRKLKNRGVILCVCSKNDETKAKEPFLKNPDMVLSLDDISVFVANWDNKADNIRTIQSVLNIGFDSMVFLDDNPFERNLVHATLPEVTVPELPDDPAQYLEYLYSQNFFETSSYSAADNDRTEQYRIEAERAAVAKKYVNEEDYLKTLCMISEVADFTRYNIPRVAQLSQRSNQFNLRTVRYSEEQISTIASNPKNKGFAFSLKDKFGNLGLIAVVILQEINADTVFIDTWFMSCRVLKRGMEYFTLNTIVAWAKSNGYHRMVGEYIPTAKNGMVAEFYSELNFKKRQDSTNQWVLDIDEYQNRTCYITTQ